MRAPRLLAVLAALSTTAAARNLVQLPTPTPSVPVLASTAAPTSAPTSTSTSPADPELGHRSSAGPVIGGIIGGIAAIAAIAVFFFIVLLRSDRRKQQQLRDKIQSTPQTDASPRQQTESFYDAKFGATHDCPSPSQQSSRGTPSVDLSDCLSLEEPTRISSSSTTRPGVAL